MRGNPAPKPLYQIALKKCFLVNTDVAGWRRGLGDDLPVTNPEEQRAHVNS